MRPALALWDAFLARVLTLLDRDCGPVADDDEIEPDPPGDWLLIRWADDDDQDES